MRNTSWLWNLACVNPLLYLYGIIIFLPRYSYVSSDTSWTDIDDEISVCISNSSANRLMLTLFFVCLSVQFVELCIWIFENMYRDGALGGVIIFIIYD
jgi:hypothetical protein